jgi:NAD(P)-dependent dehydrogenase (short-subunit alcohol dehydrogenase family)
MIWEASGKRVVVIGGGQRDGGVSIGNGRAIAVLFARHGAEVCVVDRELDRAQATVAQIAEEGGRSRAFAADVGEPAACKAIIPQAVEKLGGLDILVNNVGIYAGDTHGNALSEESFDAIMAVNLKASWLTCQAAIPHLRAAGGGVIVNISSVAALNMGPNFAYGLSKSAVNSLTARMACENARFNIRIHAVMPGPVATPMFDSQLPGSGMTRDELIADRAARVPLKRIGTAWDIAHAALFLASDQASFITGVLLPVDGGIHTVNSGGCGNPE